MPKLTQAEVKAKADEWAELQRKIAKAEDAKSAELDPFLVEYNEKTKPIMEKHDAKLGKLYSQRNAIEAEVLGWLNGVGKPIVLTGEKALAVVEKKIGSRAINVQKFFDTVKEKNAAFWACLSVGIKKAEDLIGKDKVDAISSKGSKMEAALKLK